MSRPLPTALLALLAVTAMGAACSRGADEDAQRRLLTPGAPATEAGPAAFDFGRPLDALAQDADDAARRLGSLEWSAAVEWTVERQGEDARRVRAVEHHRLRQSVTGDFEVVAEVDPGLGPGSDTGREIVLAAGRTYARARYAPWRERPTDRGRDARRFRDESFSLPRAVAALYGDALAATPAGEAKVLGRAARRFKLSLAKGAAAAPPAPRPASAPSPDEDTARRLRFLDGRVPLSADGELVLDAGSGAVLRCRLTGAFGVKDDPKARASIELLAQVKALGGAVGAVTAPKSALPDERKAAGVAGALDAAGLRRRGEEKPGREEPADEPAD